MKRCKARALVLSLALGTTLVASTPVVALEAQTSPVTVVVEAAPAPAITAAPAVPTMDPAMRALLIGIAANMLREAATSSDPMGGLSSSIERTMTGLLRSPETLRLVEGLVGMAFKDAPVELREPLALFAASMVQNLRREMLREFAPAPR
jgi:hypothetical protein